VQTTGSLAHTSLGALLETMQAERATGTLSVKNRDMSCSLYFLFGHLFHAAGDMGQGEDAVVTALAWPDGDFAFDPRAKLPAEETIKSSTPELLAAARRRGYSGALVTPPHRPLRDEPDRAPVVASASAGPPPVAQPAPSLPLHQIPPTRPSPEPVAAAPVPAARPWVPEQQPVNGERKVPETLMSHERGLPGTAVPHQVFGNPAATPIGDLYPLPSGKPVYEGLKSAFVDFPKLLRTLDSDKHTGYVRLEERAFSGVLLLHDGHVLEALYAEGSISQGMDAFQRLRRRMDAGQGLLDVIELSGETVVALAQLLTARPLFTGLLGRFINFAALIEYLNEEKIDGSLVVTGGSQMGVILLRKGNIHGAYTHAERELSASASAVTALATERDARIEVKSGAGQPPGIDVEAAFRGVA